MSKKTNIAWCDSTVNFWSGCTKVSPGCAHCYAETRDKRHMIEARDHWGKGAPRLKHVGAVKQALAMNRRPWICDTCGYSLDKIGIEHGIKPQYGDGKQMNAFCSGCGTHKNFHRRRIFSLSLGDWLDDEVPAEWLAEMLETIRQCDQVTWILCTKRPENFTGRFQTFLKTPMSEANYNIFHSWQFGFPKNIILLTSVENQEQADLRIPQLLKIPAVCHGLSLEPLLGPVNDIWIYLCNAKCVACSDMIPPNVSACPNCGNGTFLEVPGINWLIIGGESGPKSRPCNLEWIRSLVHQGQAAGVATFVKQMGSNYIHSDGKPYVFTDKKGGDPAEWPAAIRIQQWPKGF